MTVPEAPAVAAGSQVAPPRPLPPAQPDTSPDPLAAVFMYADRVRGMQGAELSQEIARSTELNGPEDQLRLALALLQTRQPQDLVRAQDLLGRIVNNPNQAQAKQFQPLARLIAARLGEQRRAEEQSERQGQQLRETQRRLDQTNEKLQALREIERSLTSRPAAQTQPGTLTPSPVRPRTRSAAP